VICRSADGITGDPELDIIHLGRDHMVDHPAGAHYVLWNGPAFLDVGVPAGGFVRFASRAFRRNGRCS